MGSHPKAPDQSAQIAAAEAQTAELKRQQAELDVSKNAVALKNTNDLKGIRRKQGGRASLITTSEQGVLTESNKLGT